jgi:lipopolysaccharide transport system permease protein
MSTGTPIIIIRPKKIISPEDLREIWRYRELLYFFTWRDLKVRYKQTMVGVGWALFQPFVTMVVFSVFFGKFAQIPSDGVPYPLFVFVGLLIWQFFSGALAETSNSLVGNQAIITKVYFPRLILPLSSILTKFVDFLIASVILAGLMTYYGYVPHLAGLFLLPILLIISFVTALGGGLILSSVNVKYRDVRYALPFFIQILLFLTPVIYPPSITGNYGWLLAINPMTGVVNAARSSLLGNGAVDWASLFFSFMISFALLVAGFIYFKKTERYFADIV